MLYRVYVCTQVEHSTFLMYLANPLIHRNSFSGLKAHLNLKKKRVNTFIRQAAMTTDTTPFM